MAKKRNQKWYYVSLYERYPIYEAAEGGYYYEGRELTLSYRTRSLNKARRILRELAAEWDMECFYNKAHSDYCYIGEGNDAYIETAFGKHEEGYKPYC